VLGPRILHRDRDPGRNVGQSHSRFGLVYVLGNGQPASGFKHTITTYLSTCPSRSHHLLLYVFDIKQWLIFCVRIDW
jgi:hypothetical protein